MKLSGLRLGATSLLVTACIAGSPRVAQVARVEPTGTQLAPPSSAAHHASWRPRVLEPKNGVFLPDFSYAGYREGEAALPEPSAASATVAVGDFGAQPDDAEDDTAAFQRALASLRDRPGPIVLTLAKGRYLLSATLFIERSDFVLRGAGAGQGGSVLVFSKPLADLPRAPVIRDIEAYLVKNDKRVDGKPFSPFSWTGGLLWTRLPAGANRESALIGTAILGKRGEHRLQISGLGAASGSRVELWWFNRYGADSPVLAEIFGLQGKLPGERLIDAQAPLTKQILTVERREGDTLWLKEPLRHDVRPEWGAELRTAPARLHDVVLEHFRIELPAEPYAGHHLERGANAIYLTDLRDSFVRDVAIQDSDSAVLSDDADHVTLSGVRVSGRHGHYGIHLGDVDSVLVRDFDIEATREHSLSFNTGARGSVFSRGHIVSPRLDQHRGRNHQNLFDAIDGRESAANSKLFEHGGADYWGPTHGAFNTFWNITLEFPGTAQPGAGATTTVTLGGVSDAGPARLIGIHANVPLSLDYPGAYQEGTNDADIAVPSLYEAQLAARLHPAQLGSTP